MSSRAPIVGLAMLLFSCAAPRAAAPRLAAPECAPAAPRDAVTQVEGFVREFRTIDVALPTGERATLEALVTRPSAPGKYPLVVINHGVPRDKVERFRMSPAQFSEQAMTFARRGYASVAALRRGFGATGGAFAETAGSCDDRHYVTGTRTAADDILAVLEAMKKESFVDPSRVLLVGVSAGGFASLAAAASNPRGVVGVLAFAPGRGSDAPDHVCQSDRLVDAARIFGASARIPTLFVYSENDHFFAPDLARNLVDAYASGGAPSQFVMRPPFKEDGHNLFLWPEEWWPTVEPFLAKLHMPSAVVTPRALPSLTPPPGLDLRGRRDFAAYLATEGYEKAFATSGGSWGWVSGKRTQEDANRAALARCDEYAETRCKLYAVGDALAK